MLIIQSKVIIARKGSVLPGWNSICWFWVVGLQLNLLRQCRQLRQLQLKGCYRIADPGLVALGCLSSLTQLNLQECWQITATGIAGLSGANRSSYSCLLHRSSAVLQLSSL